MKLILPGLLLSCCVVLCQTDSGANKLPYRKCNVTTQFNIHVIQNKGNFTD